MAKGDWVTVRSEIGGALTTDTIQVEKAGGQVEVEWDSGRQKLLVVRLLNRAGSAIVSHSYTPGAVRSVSEKHADME